MKPQQKFKTQGRAINYLKSLGWVMEDPKPANRGILIFRHPKKIGTRIVSPKLGRWQIIYV
jgi:hypothetical protein